MDKVLIVMAIPAWVLLLVFFRSHRNWLPYYILGSVGLAFVLIGMGRMLVPFEIIDLDPFSFEKLLKSFTASIVHWIATLASVETRTFPAVPGALMVLILPQGSGWTMLNIGIESSGLLEMAVVVGMVGFYPGWSMRRRFVTILMGVLATFGANVFRIAFIVAALHWAGKDVLFISHTVLGRLIFFVLVVAIFWFILSRPTLGTIYRKIKGEEPR